MKFTRTSILSPEWVCVNETCSHILLVVMYIDINFLEGNVAKCIRCFKHVILFGPKIPLLGPYLKEITICVHKD